MADTTTETALAVKPPKPDQDAYNAELAQAEKEHTKAQAELNEVKEKISLALPNKDAPSATQKRQQELIAELKSIREKQGGAKNARNTKLDQIKKIDENIRTMVNEQKNAKNKAGYKSATDIQAQINRLQGEVDEGKMRLVDEKKNLDEISRLKKLQRSFSGLESQQGEIEKMRQQIADIKKSMDDPEQKQLSERYTELQQELDAIRAERDGHLQNINQLRDERTRLQKVQSEKWAAIRKVKDDFHKAKREFEHWEYEQRKKRRERQQAERERIIKEKKMERAKAMLAEASDLAYLDEIRRAENLWIFFDPSHTIEKKTIIADSGLGATAQRKVDDSGLKGMKLVRKEDRDDDYLPAVKKGKKGKKGHASAGASESKFSCPPAIMDDCSFLGIDPPMSQAEVPATIEKIKAKLDHWKADQEAQTKRNVEKAKKEIAKLEAEEAAAEGDGTDAAVSETADKLKDANIEDKEEVAA